MGLLTNAKKTDYEGIYKKQKESDIVYIARFKHNGKTFTKTIGKESEGLTESEAYRLKLSILNTYKIQQASTRETSYYFEKLFRDFMCFRSPYLAKNTTKNYRSHLQRYFQNDFKNRDVRDINQPELQRYCNNLLLQKRPATVEKIINSLRQFYKYLHSSGIVAKDPTVYINMPKFDNKKYFSLPQKEVEKLVRYIMQIQDAKYRTIYTFLLHGRRINEVLQLKWKDVDFVNKTYMIGYKQSKNRKNYLFPLEQFQVNELLKLQEAYMGIFVFENPKTEKPLTYTSVFRVHKKLRTELNIPFLTLHSFRHLMGFLMINKGYPVEVIAKVLGHQSIYSTQRYATLKMDVAQSAFQHIAKECYAIG